MVKLVARAITDKESDLLIGHQLCHLIISECFSNDIFTIILPPMSGWTHDKLDGKVDNLVLPVNAYDAYLYLHWIGSTEV